MKKIAIAISSVLLLSGSLKAQTEADALRYSQSSVNGTAKSISMGGAFGALGGDLSVMSTNPAGIGIYRKSEFNFSPSIYTTKVTSDYLDKVNYEFKSNFNLGNIGAVFTFPVVRYDTLSGWNSWSLGIGYNRINNYHNKTSFFGTNAQNSYLDNYLEEVNSGIGTNPGNLYQYGARMAFDTYLLNPVSNADSTHYTSEIPKGGAMQSYTSTVKGATGEIPISLGGNYGDKLYIGATLGIPYINYEEDIKWQETDEKGTIKTSDTTNFKSYTLNQSISTRGTGVNFKFGMIYRVHDWLRIGASVHTPTYYQLTDEYSYEMYSEFENGNNYSSKPDKGKFNYELITPMKAIGSAALIIGKSGLISADVEFIDYSEMKLTSAIDAFYDKNQLIQDKYSMATNVRLGTEWRYNEYSFRGGFAHFGSPYKSAAKYEGADNSRTSYSLGLGIRDRNYFIDFGYVLTSGKTFFNYYTLKNQDYESAVNTNVSHNFVITTGVKF